jgi:predicted amidohydrolase
LLFLEMNPLAHPTKQTKSRLRAAAVAWKLRHVRSDGEFLAHFHDLVSMAHDEGADLVVLPELHVLELLALAPDLEEKDVPRFLVQFSQELEAWIARISSSSEMVIVGGTHFKDTGAGIVSVCASGTPDKGVVLTPKKGLTHYEKAMWRLRPGEGPDQLPDGRIGVTVSSDVLSPEAGRALAQSGALVQCVPAFTEDQRAFQRVRWCALARAVENQVFVVHASLLGNIGRNPVPSSFGSSAILSPSLEPFPVEAILAETDGREEGVAFADLDFDMLEEARKKTEQPAL